MRAVSKVTTFLSSWFDPPQGAVFLEDLAAEIYFRNLLEQCILPPVLERCAVLLIEKDVPVAQAWQRCLLSSGYRRAVSRTEEGERKGYFREDVGWIFFRTPKPAMRRAGVLWAAEVEPLGREILNQHHTVVLESYGKEYEANVPPVGLWFRQMIDSRFSRAGVRAIPHLHRAAAAWVLFWRLFAKNPHIEQELLEDLSQTKPFRRLKATAKAFEEAGPGSLPWEAARRLFVPEKGKWTPAEVESWYWRLSRKWRRLKPQKGVLR